MIIRSGEKVTDPASRPKRQKNLPGISGCNRQGDFFLGVFPFIHLGCSRDQPAIGSHRHWRKALPQKSAGKKSMGRATEYNKEVLKITAAAGFEYPYPVAVNVAGNIGGMEYPVSSLRL